MMPRIGIPWYRAKIKQSVFEDAGQPRGFNFDLDFPKSLPIPNPVEVQAPFPVLVSEPFPVLVAETFPSIVPVPVTNPLVAPVPNPVNVPVPNPVTSPVNAPVPNPVTSPVNVPVPKPVNIPNPKPILPPLKEREKEEGRVNNPVPTYSEMLAKQKETKLQEINQKAYREQVQYDMLMERNLQRQRSLNPNSKLKSTNLIQYNKYLTSQTISEFNRIAMSKEVMEIQVKEFNNAMGKIEVKLGKGTDIILDYIKNNEITFATMPHHYKEINKEIAQAGLTGLAVGAVAYILFQIAKVALVAYGVS